MPLFTDRPQIFQRKDLLEPDHLPDTFQSRSEELETYKDALYPVYKGEKPKNIFIYGDAGTGKTSVTKYILDHLEQDAATQDVEITPIYVSCSTLKNSYQLAIELTNTLREHRLGHSNNNLPNKGYSRADIIDFLFDELEQANGTVLLVLDELNNINDYDLLYEIPRAHSNERLNRDTRLPGIIGISNDVNYLDTLPPKIEDTLNQESIRFDPYSATELETILNARAPDAFHTDVLNDDVIPLCAALAAQENGSARRALRLLRIAGELTRNDHDTTVTQQHVKRAEAKLDRDLVKETINAGTIQTQLALLAVATATSKIETPERTSNLHTYYKTIANDTGYNALKHDRFRQRLDTLSEQNIINSETKSDNGRYSQYHLHKDLLVVLEALSDSHELIDALKTIINYAYQNDILTDDDIDELDL